MQLKTILLWRLGNGCGKSCQAVALQPAIGISEQQHCTCRKLNASVSCSGNSCMDLSDKSQRIIRAPLANAFGSILFAAVINDNYFETRGVELLRQRVQTTVKRGPVVVNSYNNAE